MKHVPFFLTIFGLAVLAASCGGNDTKTGGTRAASISDDYYVVYQISGPHYETSDEFTIDQVMPVVFRGEALTISARREDAYARILITATSKGTYPWEERSNTIIINPHIPSFEAGIEARNGAYEIVEYIPNKVIGGTFKGQGYVSLELHDIVVEFRIPIENTGSPMR